MTCTESWCDVSRFHLKNDIYRPKSLTSLNLTRLRSVERNYDVTSTWSDTRSAQNESLSISNQGMQFLKADFEDFSRFRNGLHNSAFNLNRIRPRTPSRQGVGKVPRGTKNCHFAPYGARPSSEAKTRLNYHVNNSDETRKCHDLGIDKPQHRLENLLSWFHKSGKKAADKLKKRGNIVCQKADRAETIRKPKASLLDTLCTKDSLSSFRKYLAKELSEENLDFWLEVESYKKQKQPKQRKIAAKIYAKYLSTTSPHEINIDCVVRQITKQNLLDPDSSSFDLAQKCAFELMECDSFRRYIS